MCFKMLTNVNKNLDYCLFQLICLSLHTFLIKKDATPQILKDVKTEKIN